MGLDRDHSRETAYEFVWSGWAGALAVLPWCCCFLSERGATRRLATSFAGYAPKYMLGSNPKHRKKDIAGDAMAFKS